VHHLHQEEKAVSEEKVVSEKFTYTNLDHAIDVAEHLIIVLKRMRDDPEGNTGGAYPLGARGVEAALKARWHAVLSDLYSLVDTLNELPKPLKYLFDTVEWADVEDEDSE
jgi:hypothetical protein